MRGKKAVFRGGLIAVVIAAVGFLVAALVWFQDNLLESILETNYSFLKEVTNQEAITVQTKLSGQWEQLTLYARIFENIDMNDYKAVKDALNVTEGFGQFKRISVANDVGYVINNDNTASGNIMKQEYYMKAMQGESCISESLDVDADGNAIFVLSIPIYQKQEVVGALLGTFDRESVQELISEEVFGGHGTFYIIDGQGRIIITGKNSDIAEQVENYFYYLKRTSLPKSEQEKMKENIARDISGIIEYKIAGKEKAVCYQSIPINDWTLVSVVNKNFIMEQRKHISWLVAVFICMVVLAVAALVACMVLALRQSGKENQDNEKLKIKAERDSLTNLYNKISLENYIRARILEPAVPQEAAFALYIMDMDNFKNINDSLGHAFGDTVLCDAASCMNRIFGPQDLLGRVGGDEFMALKDMREIPPEKREEVIKKKAALLCQDFSRTYTSHNTSYKVSVSVGVAVFGLHGTTFEELYKNADRALYMTKKKGKNNYSICQLQKTGEGEDRI